MEPVQTLVHLIVDRHAWVHVKERQHYVDSSRARTQLKASVAYGSGLLWGKMELLHTVTMTLTEKCNLQCLYCYEHNRSDACMSFETAKRIIDYELDHSRGYNLIEFDMFGGEPFIEFDLIKRICEYTYTCNPSIDYRFFVTTNGTLVDKRVQEWLEENPKVICGLSLDGTRDMHNANRSNSFDRIDLPFFLEHYPEQDVKMTISYETLESLAEGVIYLHEVGFRVSCNLAYNINWPVETSKKILENQLSQLVTYYLNNRDVTPCSLIATSILEVGYDNENAHRPCGAGNEMVAYDVYGNKYPCHFFMPISVGKEKASKANHIAFPKEIIPDNFLVEECKTCVIKPICPHCYGANYARTGNIFVPDRNLCILVKEIMKARSFYYGMLWKNHQLELSRDDEQALLRGIIAIQENC